MPQAMTRDELLGLPAMITMTKAFEALGVSRSVGYRMIHTGTFPTRLIPIGKSFRVASADLCAALGVTAPPPAAPTPAPAE
jgi:predicted DNA-binding transcriptional regulator AlpA